MDTIGFLASHTKAAGSISPSALFRYAHALHPTFLMDELTKNKLRQSEELRAIINLGHARGGVKTITEALKSKKFDAIIIDELTAFKNNTSKRTRAMKKIVRHVHTQVKRRGLRGMSGAPTANSPLASFG